MEASHWITLRENPSGLEVPANSLERTPSEGCCWCDDSPSQSYEYICSTWVSFLGRCHQSRHWQMHETMLMGSFFNYKKKSKKAFAVVYSSSRSFQSFYIFIILLYCLHTADIIDRYWLSDWWSLSPSTSCHIHVSRSGDSNVDWFAMKTSEQQIFLRRLEDGWIYG